MCGGGGPELRLDQLEGRQPEGFGKTGGIACGDVTAGQVGDALEEVGAVLEKGTEAGEERVAEGVMLGSGGRRRNGGGPGEIATERRA